MNRRTDAGLTRRSCLALAGAAFAPQGRADEALPRPGDDFFAWANADWLRERAAADPARPWTARLDIDQRTHAQLQAIWRQAGAASPDPLVRKLAAFRDAWQDSARIESLGMAPLRPLLARIDTLRDHAALAQFLGAEMRCDVDPVNWGVFASAQLFGFAVQPDVEGLGRHQAYLVQGGLSGQERSLYLDEAARPQRAAHLERLGRRLEALGQRDAARRAEAVLALEQALAEAHETAQASDDTHRAERRWTAAEFARRAPGLDWPRFIGAAGLGQQAALVPWQPEAIRAQAALVASTPIEVWRDHLRLNLLQRHAQVLPAALGGRDDSLAREDSGHRTLDRHWPEALGRLYVERHFPPPVRARVQAIVVAIRTEMRAHVDALPWMSPATRAQAQAKLAALNFGVGHPERWLDHAALRFDARDAFGNLRRLAAWERQQALARLGRPASPADWWIAAQAVAAGSLPQVGAYNFAAGLLQAPRFDATGTDAANFGSFGAIAGHEIWHLFDEVGADFDAANRYRPWWSEGEREALQRASQPLLRQLAAAHPVPGLTVDGPRVLTEARAELTGLQLAFDAHRRRLGGAAPEAQRAADREFFTAYARCWRRFDTDESLRRQIATDNHLPARWQVALLRNFDAWHEAFDVRPGQAMYLDPEQRLRLA